MVWQSKLSSIGNLNNNNTLIKVKNCLPTLCYFSLVLLSPFSLCPWGGDYNELIASKGLCWDEFDICGGDREGEASFSVVEFSCFFLFILLTQTASFSLFFLLKSENYSCEIQGKNLTADYSTLIYRFLITVNLHLVLFYAHLEEGCTFSMMESYK